MKLGTQDKDFFPVDIMDKFFFVKELGFDCFEIDGKVLIENIDVIQKAMDKSGLIISTACGGYNGWIGDFDNERRVNGIKEIKEILRCISLVGGSGVVVPAAWGMFTFRLPPMKSPRTIEQDKQTIIRSLEELDGTAGEYGVNLYLEPLNRYQDHMLNLTKDAYDIIVEGNFSNVKITADFYHMSIEEDDITETLIEFKDYIGHIHIAENHRYQPGTGSIDFKKHLGTLKNLGYRGAVVYEGRVRGDNPLEAYKESIAYVKPFL